MMTNQKKDDDHSSSELSDDRGTTTSTTVTINEDNVKSDSTGVRLRGGNNNGTIDGGSRVPFTSRHRRVLDRILSDSFEARCHPVPQFGRKGFMDNYDGGDNDDQDRSPRDGDADPDAERLYDQGQRRYTSRRDTSEIASQFDCSSCLPGSFHEWMTMLLPMYTWLRVYDWKANFSKDLVAGLTVGVMIIPQSMSYAKLAGLPVEFGLYSALVPVYAYAFFGSSRQLAVGPVALISLLLSTGLTLILEKEGFSEQDDPEAYQKKYNQLAVQTSFLVGVTYIVMGLARLGFVTIFLSHAVISGFTTGAAVIIGMSQVKYIFGYDVEKSDRLHVNIKNIIEGLGDFNYKTFLMGTTSIMTLVFLKNLGKTYPKLKWTRAMGPLFVTAITILLVFAFDLDNKGIPVVASIPSGFPSLTVDQWSPIDVDFGNLFIVVISIVVVGFMESISIAKQLASKHKYEIDSSTELIGLGMANFLGGMFQSYPVTGSFSRSAVNHETGALSGISAMITATMVLVILLLLTPVFELMPLNVLAAVVVSGVLGLLDYEEAQYLWKVHKFDFAVWLIACFGTMFLGVEIGLAIAVGVSLLIVVYESAYPNTIVLGRLPGTVIYRNVKQYPEAERYDGIVMVRIDGPIYFANAQHVRDKIRKYRLAAQDELDANHTNADVKFIIIEMSPVSHIDTSALHILDDMYVTYKSRGQQVCFSNPSMLVMERLANSGLAAKIGNQHFFACMNDAVNWCLSEMDVEAMSNHDSSVHAGIIIEDDEDEDGDHAEGGQTLKVVATESTDNTTGHASNIGSSTSDSADVETPAPSSKGN